MSYRAVGLFVARRLGALLILLLVISFGIFALLYLAPGSIEQLLLGTRPTTPETLRAIRAQYNLDDPFLSQYLAWLQAAVQLDFGESIRTNQSVTTMIGDRLGVSVFLGVYAFVLTIMAGVPLGIWAARRARTAVDRSIVGMSVAGISSPPFATGFFLLFVFAVWLGIFPVFGAGGGFGDRLVHLTLPAITLALTAIALVVKLTRSAMIHALEQDYVLAARARGVSEAWVVVRYALRNALIPVITSGGLIFGYMVTGAVLIEVTFALPGVGSLLIDALEFKDVPVVQGVAMLAAVVVVLANLSADLLYLVADPRVRFGSVEP